MKSILVFGIIMLGLVSCKKDKIQKINLDADYLPLEIGNQWIFELAGKDSIVNKQIINGIEYFEIINSFGNSSYYRNQDNRIFVKTLSIDSKEEMKFDLAAKVNDTWTYGPGYVKLVSRGASIIIGETQIDSCLQFNFYNQDLIDYGSTIFLAPRIGFIQQSCQECFGSAFNTIKLIKAKINNQIIEFK